MNKIRLFGALVAIFAALPSYCQDSASIIEKTAAAVSKPNGITAYFDLKGSSYGNTSGYINVKGDMFHIAIKEAEVWFDGKTQWTYVKDTQEVNVVDATEAQAQSMNPYHFINMYKNGYSSSVKEKTGCYEIHLVADNDKTRVQEVYIETDKTSYIPQKIKMLLSGTWNILTVTDFKTSKVSDSKFRFSQSDYPDAEVIDLR